MMDKVFSRNIAIVMGDMTAKVGCKNTGIESVMGQQGVKFKMNENGELLTDFCATKELVIGGTLFPHKECHKTTLVSPDGKTQNQIDHIALSHRWKSSLQDVIVKRGADVGTDHHLVIGKIKIKLARPIKKKVWRIRYNTKKLTEGDLRDTFAIKLQNRFESLYVEEGNEEASEVKNAYLDTCEEVLGKKRRRKTEDNGENMEENRQEQSCQEQRKCCQNEKPDEESK